MNVEKGSKITRDNTYVGWVTRSNNHAHMQWALYVILHRFWANQRHVGAFYPICSNKIPSICWNTIPLDVTLNLLLVCSISLGHPVEGEALKIQDKRYAVLNFHFTPLTYTTISSVCLAQVIS